MITHALIHNFAIVLRSPPFLRAVFLVGIIKHFVAIKGQRAIEGHITPDQIRLKKSDSFSIMEPWLKIKGFEVW